MIPGEGTFTYAPNAQVQLIAQESDPNHIFAYWKKDGEFYTNVNPLTVTVKESYSIRAYFEAVEKENRY